MPQKQPPARIAFSVVSVIVPVPFARRVSLSPTPYVILTGNSALGAGFTGTYHGRAARPARREALD
jgi:hypothetical protein